MRKTSIWLLTLILVFSMVTVAGANPFEVTEPITITWWHSHEGQWYPYLEHMVAQFEAANPLIKVEPIFIGTYPEMNTRFIAAMASGDVPAIISVKTNYLPNYGAAGMCEVLDPYIEADNFDVMDFGEGLANATSYEGEQIALPYLISTRLMYYNKTLAEAEGIEMPKTFDEFEEFLEKATVFNPDGTTARYGTIFAGWDHTYFENLYKNNGVEVIREDGTSDLNEEMSVYITTKIKEWVDKGYTYFQHGTSSSSILRSAFWDERTFSVFHTSSLYDTYQNDATFEVGMSWMPGSADGTKYEATLSGAYILIPSIAPQRQKNAAWQFMKFMVSPEINLYWADQTGYFPTRQTVINLPEYEEYLERKPAMASILEMSGWIVDNDPRPYYETCGKEWRMALAKIFSEGAPVQETLDKLVKDIEDIIDDF
mgnify:CR=1 FL=1